MSLHALAAVAAISLFMPIHDMSDPNAAWYQSLVVPGEPGSPFAGASCCSGGSLPHADCQNVETRIRSGHWEAYIDSKTFPDTDYSPVYGHAANAWVKVPEGAIIHGKSNPTGRPIVCWYSRSIRCFIEGIGT